MGAGTESANSRRLAQLEKREERLYELPDLALGNRSAALKKQQHFQQPSRGRKLQTRPQDSCNICTALGSALAAVAMESGEEIRLKTSKLELNTNLSKVSKSKITAFIPERKYQVSLGNISNFISSCTKRPEKNTKKLSGWMKPPSARCSICQFPEQLSTIQAEPSGFQISGQAFLSEIHI